MKATQSTLTLLLFTIGLISLGSGSTQADTVFLDDFSDGDLFDNDPVSWSRGSIVSEDLVLTGVGVPTSEVIRLDIAEVSVRTVFELADGAGIGIGARSKASSYFGYLFVDSVDDSVFYAGLSTGGALCCTDLVDAVEVPFDPRQEAIAMQLDMFSDNIRLWVWPAAETMPTEPLLEDNDSRLVSGTVFTWVAGEDWDQPNSQDVATGRFRYVHVADMHIPEPSTVLLAILGMTSLCCFRRRR